jgi:N-acetylglutamate synthase-like GNAT family acetyltransferase
MIETIRLLPSEWKRLPREANEDLPTPDQCIAVVAIKDTKSIGRAFLVSPVHVEGIWIDPASRNKTVMKRLVDGVEQEARLLKLKYVFAYAVDQQMENYMERLGYEKLSWTVWRKAL